MSWDRLENLLNQMFAEVNRSNEVPSPQDLWDTYQSEIQPLLSEHRQEFVELSTGLWLPKAIETGRILSQLRQRFNADQEGRRLTGRIRTEVVLRQRPIRNIAVQTLRNEERHIADIAAKLPARPITNFSQFQIEGWDQTLQAIRNIGSLVIVAPTGSGKTEVFLLPLIYEIARQIRTNPKNASRFVLLYPRVELLKDQLSRIFRYVYQAEQNQLTDSGQLELFRRSRKVSEGIIIGFQFSGIASEATDTLQNAQVFDENKRFKILQDECCPVCSNGNLLYNKKRGSVPELQCSNEACSAVFKVSIAKNYHAKYKPHILVTTAESLDRLYLNPNPEFERYLRSLKGVLFDEVHLYHSLYGAHIHHLIRRIEDLSEHRLAKIAASATVANPERFASKFFHGDESHPVTVHDAAAPEYPKEPSGLEVIYFLQSPEEENRAGAAPTLIQSVMAIGHGLLRDRDDRRDRGIVFTESLDLTNRLFAQIRDAEGNRLELWRFRTVLNDLEFQGQGCPNTTPALCASHYLQGECWRGIFGGTNCTQLIPGFRERTLDISSVSSQGREDYWNSDIVVATPSLEVGVDDDRIIVTFHYRPPRTVFSFIQRRGRAGRAADAVAHTLMILANTASDHFYFFRRNRLVYGSYELPLNPSNPVLRAMHDRIARERSRMHYHIARPGNNIPAGILDWIWEKLEESPIIRDNFGDWLEENRNAPNKQRQRHLKAWIHEQRQRFEDYLNLRWNLLDIENESPDTLTQAVQEVFGLVRRYLDGETDLRKNIRDRLEHIYTELGKLAFAEEDAEARQEILTLQANLLTVWDRMQRPAELGIGFDQADGLYNFFHTLEKFRGSVWILNSAPDVIKTVLQALFYLRTASGDANPSQSAVDFFIPDAYFNEVKPIIVAVRTSRGNRTELKQEDTTKLSTLLLPYRTAYRYHRHPLLSVVETEHDPRWVQARWAQGGTVGVRLLGEGVHLTGDRPEFRPEKVYVKALKGDKEGKQVVKMCPECFAIYSENRTRRCHNVALRSVRLYAEAIIERTYSYRHDDLSRVSHTLQLVSDLSGDITVIGSTARVENMLWEKTKKEYVTPRNSQPWNFEALYVGADGKPEPVRYGLQTKGIAWNLREVTERLLQDDRLKSQVEGVEIDGTRKTFNRTLILHTASHMLQKAIASISGVNEQVLEYCFREDTSEVVVWERYEGGAGISEVFVEALRSNRVDVYRELLASVLCPVNLAERTDWLTPDDLSAELITNWHLHDADSLVLVDTIVREASAERQVERHQPDENGEVQIPLQCQQRDGCPACLHTNNCTERFEQPHAVSHFVAEALLRALVQPVNLAQVEQMRAAAVQQGIAPPTILTADPQREVYHILLI